VERPIGELLAETPNFGSMNPPSKAEHEWLSLRLANIRDWNLDLTDAKYIDLPERDVSARADRQFTTDDARIKLKHLYPAI
jgi:hypothetical protein